MVVIGLGKNLLFKSILAHCAEGLYKVSNKANPFVRNQVTTQNFMHLPYLLRCRAMFLLTFPIFFYLVFWQVQGVSHWNGGNQMALRGSRIENFDELWCLGASRGFDIWVSSITFQKSNLGCPQQPPTEKVLKFNLIFHDSTKKKKISEHQNNIKISRIQEPGWLWSLQ